MAKLPNPNSKKSLDETHIQSLKEAMESGGVLRAAKRRKPKITKTKIGDVFAKGNKKTVKTNVVKNPKINKSKVIEEKLQTNSIKISKLINVEKLSKENHKKLHKKKDEEIQTNKIKITKLISVNQLHRENHKKKDEDITNLKKTVTELSEAVKKDLADRLKDSKKKKEEARKAAEKEKQADEETSLEEAGKEASDKVQTKTNNFIQPIGNIFQKLLSAVGAIGLGIVGNAAFKFLGDPANYEKIMKVFGFIQKHWKWVVGGLGAIALLAIAGPIVAVVATVGSIVAAFAGVAVVIAKIALGIGLIVAAVFGAAKLFNWLRGGDAAAEARQANRKELDAAGIKRTRNKFGKAGFDVMRDGKKVFLKYEELNDEERAAVDKFEMEDERIKAVTKERNKTSQERKKAIENERKESEEYKAIIAMPRGKDKRIALDTFKAETIRLQNESDKKIAEEFANKMKSESLIQRKIGGSLGANQMALVGEGGPELVKFDTSSSVVRSEKTQETLRTLSEGANDVTVITENLPPITSPPPEVRTPSVQATDVIPVNAFNSMNPYMTLTPELLKIT